MNTNPSTGKVAETLLEVPSIVHFALFLGILLKATTEFWFPFPWLKD